MEGLADLKQLAASLAIGLLIGIERGWLLRGQAPGTRVAGLRTFGLIGLLGGASMRLSKDLGPAIFVVAFAALAALLIVSYAARVRSTTHVSATTEVAALLTFMLGAGPPGGWGVVSAAVGVVVVALLAWKEPLHAAVAGLEQGELRAAIKLLALAFVLLPVLPDEGLGPWGAINLHEVLWMVLLLAGLSFVGYVVVKRLGAHWGLGVSALVGGLVSSTAVTMDFARRSALHPTLTPLLAAGSVAAGGTMFVRVLVVVALLAPGLLPLLAPALGLAALLCWALAFAAWRRTPTDRTARHAVVGSPLALGLAFKFAALLAFVSVLAAALRAWLGDAGVYPLAVVAGLGDVDAITLTLSRQHVAGLAASVAAHGILIACAMGTLFKVAVAWWIGGRAIGARLLAAFGIAMAAGAGALVLAELLL